jgi:hypothetical protein
VFAILVCDYMYVRVLCVTVLGRKGHECECVYAPVVFMFSCVFITRENAEIRGGGGTSTGRGLKVEVFNCRHRG